ncbi:MAG: DoxX family protein [Bacteroidales bacterium]|nr:DoxX family protein [Bacteroidales bacterium]
MKKYKIIFWVTTGIIFLFEGVMPAFTSQTEMAKEGIRHLGYPDYFGVMLTVFKVLGALALIIPRIPGRIKEWAYAGFAFDFIAAFVSNWAVDGLTPSAFFPLVFVGILVLSYVNFHKLQQND